MHVRGNGSDDSGKLRCDVPIFFGNACLYNKILCVICKAFFQKSGPISRRGRPPLTPEVYVEYGGNQYNITDVVERAKADYRTTHKVGVQSCKVYVKPEEGAAYYVINKVSGKLEL